MNDWAGKAQIGLYIFNKFSSKEQNAMGGSRSIPGQVTNV
jgi:hypothetical protein